jgi:hypothetical protein
MLSRNAATRGVLAGGQASTVGAIYSYVRVNIAGQSGDDAV